jgi:hypothetical protein
MALTAAPVAAILYAKFSSEHCGASCSENTDSGKDFGGCEKQGCFTFSCCQTLVFLPPAQKNTIPFQLESATENNFILKELFISLRPFDIWHPPKFI